MANFTPEELEEILQQFFDVTGKRQYVGARYVPIFGRKDENSIEWDNSAPYEPLTIVLYQGNSYTSRTYVPAGVAITDTHFWANTGNYNAQVEQYRQDVLVAKSDIEQIKTVLPFDAFSETDTVKNYIDANKAPTVKFIFPSEFGVDSYDANILQIDESIVMIDCGNNQAYTKVKSCLTANDISHIDYLIITHYHADHYGNLGNLITDNFIDNTTTIIVPPDGIYISQYNVTTAHDYVINTANENNISVVYAYDNYKLNVHDIEITFLNANEYHYSDLYDLGEDYNGCSMVNIINVFGCKSLFAGDISMMQLKSMLDNGELDSTYEFYKIEHHGINFYADYLPAFATIANDTMSVVRAISPKYAYQPCGTEDDEINNLSRNITIALLAENDTTIYNTLDSDHYCAFEVRAAGVTPIVGNSVGKIGTVYAELSVYVNAATTLPKQDGSTTYPFKELSQAIYSLPNSKFIHWNVVISSGDYNISHPRAEKNAIEISNKFIDLRRRTSSDVVNIHNSITLFNSEVLLNNVNLTNGYMECISGVVTLSSVAFSGLYLTKTEQLRVSRNCKLLALQCDFSNATTGISTDSTFNTIKIIACTFSNLTNGIQTDVRNTFITHANTFTNVTTEKSGAFDEIITNYPASSRTLSSTDDLNNVTTIGYYFAPTSLPTNSPSTLAAAPFSMLVMPTTNARVCQVIFITLNVYYRRQTANGWTNWYSCDLTAVQ